MSGEEEAKTTAEEEAALEAAAAASAPAAEAEAAAAAAGGGEDEENAPANEEEESNAVFEPVVQLDEVEAHTGEEDEEAVYTQRAKLYLYAETLLNAGTGKKEWKERGIGNVRLLRHNDHGRIRVVMRQERTHKLLINHALVGGLVLVPHAASDRCVCWKAEDFSDLQTLQETNFCLRFGSTEILDAFKDAFYKYQKEMVDLDSGSDAAGQEAGDAAAEALGGLTVAGGGNENEPDGAEHE